MVRGRHDGQNNLQQHAVSIASSYHFSTNTPVQARQRVGWCWVCMCAPSACVIAAFCGLQAHPAAALLPPPQAAPQLSAPPAALFCSRSPNLLTGGVSTLPPYSLHSNFMSIEHRRMMAMRVVEEANR